MMGIIAEHNVISDIGERIYNIDETAVKYLMKLSNNYIRAKVKSDETSIDKSKNLFAKYGFDVETLNGEIAKISDEYTLDNKIGPCKAQEHILQRVFDYFECPGKLPTIEDLHAITSKFGIDYTDEGKLPNIDSRNFDNPYNFGGYFNTAIENGLSIDQIIESKLQLEQMMELYEAPRPGRSLLVYYSSEVTSIVPHLNSDIKKRAEQDALKIYKIMNYKLIKKLQNSESKLSQSQDTTNPIHR